MFMAVFHRSSKSVSVRSGPDVGQSALLKSSGNVLDTTVSDALRCVGDVKLGYSC